MTAGLRRPCLDCGVLVRDASRCSRHAKTTTAARGYDAAWQALSLRARRVQPWCSHCGDTRDLTTDHLRWPARTLADVQVLCRPCNSRKGQAR